MRGGALLFALALLGSAAGWFLLVHPAESESAARAQEIERTDIAGAWARARSWPGPTAAQARRLEESFVLFASPPPGGPPPAGLHSEGRGVLSGSLPWAQVQSLLAWVAARPESVSSVEVSATPGSPELASCRVVLAVEAPR